eukprot:1152488-Pelagomonas_calceolata.AAC.2
MAHVLHLEAPAAQAEGHAHLGGGKAQGRKRRRFFSRTSLVSPLKNDLDSREVQKTPEPVVLLVNPSKARMHFFLFKPEQCAGSLPFTFIRTLQKASQPVLG